MQTVSISISDRLKQFLDEQVDSGRYASVSDYVRSLISGDEKRHAQEKLELALIEGIESGEPTEMTSEDWADIRRIACAQFEERKAGKSG